MKCQNCEHGEMADSNDNYHYRESGLDNVTIFGITVRKCAECGNIRAWLQSGESNEM